MSNTLSNDLLQLYQLVDELKQDFNQNGLADFSEATFPEQEVNNTKSKKV